MNLHGDLFKKLQIATKQKEFEGQLKKIEDTCGDILNILETKITNKANINQYKVKLRVH